MPQQNDPGTAVLELFREHGTPIYRFALVLCRQRDEAEDVVQETFLKLLQHLERGGDTTNLRGWLFTVAAHACRDRQRRRLRWLPLPSEAARQRREGGWSATSEPSVGPPVLRDEDGRIEAARDGLSRLPRRDRLLLTLRAQGLSYREIAAAAHIRLASVGRLLARAIDRWERSSTATRRLTPRPVGPTFRSGVDE